MLLLIFSGSYGVSVWAGPTPGRTIDIEPETRTAQVVQR